MKPAYTTVDDYIRSFPEPTRILLEKLRTTIRDAAPDALEGISYGMPAYKFCGKPLVYFAAYRAHIGFYATPSGHSQFAKELSPYKQGKGSVQFPLAKPLPLKLIGTIVRFRVDETRREKDQR